jgi:hypothetical protein
MTTDERREHIKAVREKARPANIGNKNSSKSNRLLNQTLTRVLTQEDGKIARQLVDILIARGLDGDMTAIKEIFDRHEGKSISKAEISGPDGSEIPVSIGLNFVKPAS